MTNESEIEVRHWLRRGASVDWRDSSGKSSLILASEKGNTGILTLLLASKANVNLIADNGMTSLMTAAYYGKEDVVHALINAGADTSICGGGNIFFPHHDAAGWAKYKEETKGNIAHYITVEAPLVQVQLTLRARAAPRSVFSTF